MSFLREVLLQLGSVKSGSLTPVFGLLIDTALKGSLLIAAAAVAAYLLRDRSASARHAAWSAAVVGNLALPILTLLAPQWRLPILPAPPWLDVAVVAPAKSALPGDQTSASLPTVKTPSLGVEANAANASPSTLSVGAATRSAAERKSTSPDGWPIISILGMTWIIGVLLVLSRLAFGTWRVGRLAKQGSRVADGEWLSLTQRLANRLGITRPLTLLRGESLAVPVTWGVVYPAVLLPPDADQWPEARRRFVLVHEMAHVKRFDALTQLIAQFAIALLWFDPFIWLAAHKMRVEREHACDDYVLRDGTVPSLYASELLEMVQSIGTPRHESAAPAFAALAMARRSEFEGRMLAILDPRLERHKLGRGTAIASSVALALLVVPLAALRPFHNPAPFAIVSANEALKNEPEVLAGRQIRDDACDSAWSSPKRSTSSHIHIGASGNGSYVEYLTTGKNRCTQVAMIGKASFLNDRLISLSPGSFASFREKTADADRTVRVTPEGAGLRYIATRNGRPGPYDDSMREWLENFMPEILRNAAIDVPARIARDMKRGGVGAVLFDIGRTSGISAKRTHYEALLLEPSLSLREYEMIARQAGRDLAASPTDLSAVLTLITAPSQRTKSLAASVGNIVAAQETMTMALGVALKTSSSSADSASTYEQYAAATDDPEVILMAIRGAHDLSSDTDKRVLLQMIAPRVLGKNNPRLRAAFFEAAGTMTSDTDLRVLLQTALPYGHVDQAVTLAVFSLVGSHMTSDSERRVTLTTAAEQHLLTTSAARDAYAAAARRMTSNTDYVVTMQAALKQ